MTEEEIIDAGVEYTMSTHPMAIGGALFNDEMREMNRSRAFEAGAKWGVEKQKEIIERLQFLQDNTLKALQDVRRDTTELTLDRVCKYLSRGSTLLDILNINDADDLQRFIEALRKEMAKDSE